MPSFTTVNKVDENNFIVKNDTYKTRAEADERISELHKISGYEDAFVVDNDETSIDGLMCFQAPKYFPVNKSNKTVSFDKSTFDADKRSEDMESLREERNNRLVATDIAVLPDRWAAMSDDTKTAWTNHRQALRDLPANTADPANPTWPTKPGD
jgi:hypothetical protein